MNIQQRLVEIFKRFPTVGSRTASRFVYYLMKLDHAQTDELINEIKKLKERIKFCSFCFQPYEDADCPICQNPGRDKTVLCVVEKEADLATIEGAKRYKGLYFILGEYNPRVDELKNRVKTGGFSELIIATNPTLEGNTLSFLAEKALKDLNLNIKITHLGRGLPVGGELEYADEETLGQAFDSRR